MDFYDIPHNDRAINFTILINSTVIKEIFKIVNDQLTTLFSCKAFLHTLQANEAESNMKDIVSDFHQQNEAAGKENKEIDDTASAVPQSGPPSGQPLLTSEHLNESPKVEIV